MNPTTPNDQSTNNIQVNNPLSAMRAGESNIFEVRRHPIGLIGMYATFGILLLIVAVVAIIAPSVLTDYNRNTVQMIGIAAFLLAAVFSALFVVIGHYVYNGNRWILTSDSLTQVSQVSLFNKQNSQLSLGNLEDISAVQNGILPHMFNYGILKVETAGERSKFSFPYCPNPNVFAQKILAAREAFEQGERGAGTADTPATPVGVNTNVPQ